MKLRTSGAIGLIGTVILLGIFIFWGFLFVGGGRDLADGPAASEFRANAVLSTLMQYESAVTQYARAHGKLEGAGATIDIKVLPGGVLSRAFVSDRATMIGVDAKNEVVVVLEPFLDGQTIRWECSVIPPKASPAACRKK
jgi:hypothetical protein